MSSLKWNPESAGGINNKIAARRSKEYRMEVGTVDRVGQVYPFSFRVDVASCIRNDPPTGTVDRIDKIN